MVEREPPMLRILLVVEHNAADAAHPSVVSFLFPHRTVSSNPCKYVVDHNAADAAHPSVVSFLSPQLAVSSNPLQVCGRA